MDFSSVDLALFAKLLLLMLVGLGPKIALVPFIEKTKDLEPAVQREVGTRMVIVAVVTALILFATGWLLLRMFHISTGAVEIAGGLVLLRLALGMAAGPTDEVVREVEGRVPPADPMKLALYPLAVPYLLNPVGISVLIVASSNMENIGGALLVVLVVLLVGGFDLLVFRNMDTISKRLRPTVQIVSEAVFGILLTAVAIQLVATGLNALGIIQLSGGH
ncbi:MAG: MarC family protein [Geminicoccaceae bacterium]|nr:MarC family protein [Geminicoccaceae bacterium]MCB2011865.1 MarC family protein [Geminicoccaceae bacterium]